MARNIRSSSAHQPEAGQNEPDLYIEFSYTIFPSLFQIYVPNEHISVIQKYTHHKSNILVNLEPLTFRVNVINSLYSIWYSIFLKKITSHKASTITCMYIQHTYLQEQFYNKDKDMKNKTAIEKEQH